MRTVSEQIADYVPQTLAPEVWAAVGDHVRRFVAELEPDTVAQARDRLMKLSQYLGWCWQVGYALEREQITNVRVLDDYLTHLDRARGRATARSYRDKLNVYLPRLAGPLRPSFDATSVPVENTAYSQAELISIASWTKAQPTERWRRNATAIAALAGGCGLRTNELVRVRGNHIHTRGTRLAVHVEGERPRFAPVLAFWERSLRRLAADTPPDAYVFDIPQGARTPRKVPVFVGNSRHHEVRPTPERLRATWIHTLVESGVPTDLVLQAAGLRSAISLNPYLAQLPTRDDNEQTWALIHSAGR